MTFEEGSINLIFGIHYSYFEMYLLNILYLSSIYNRNWDINSQIR